MINTVTVINNINEKLKVTLNEIDPPHGLLISNIEGLGPVKANINVDEYLISDGGLYNFAKLGSRNIVIDFIFLFKNTIEDVRQLTYKYFPIKKPVTLIIETDNRTLKTVGYVESNEPNIFSDEEGCKISLICPDPFLYEAKIGRRTVPFFGVNKLFEFPYENDSLTENKTEFGEIYQIREQPIYNEGDYEVGIIIECHITDTIENIYLYNRTLRQMMTIYTDKITEQTGKALGNGDVIIKIGRAHV